MNVSVAGEVLVRSAEQRIGRLRIARFFDFKMERKIRDALGNTLFVASFGTL